MEMKMTRLTLEDKEKLEKELKYLTEIRRPEIAEELKVARSYGDLSENAEYDAARDEQAKVESQIKDISRQLENSIIIETDNLNTDHVHTTHFVELENLKNNTVKTFQIVVESAADFKKGTISEDSPVGKACLGHSVGDIVDVEAPAGTVPYKILKISK